jgi:hypothetical protein
MDEAYMTSRARSVSLPAWWAAIALLAVWGLALRIDDGLDSLSYFTQQSNLLVAAYYTWLVAQSLRGRSSASSRNHPGIHAAITVYIVITGVVYATLLDANYSEAQDVLSHALVPVLAVVDWLLRRGGQRALRAWYPLGWLAYPMGYLCFVLVRATFTDLGSDGAASGEGRYLYPFLNLDVKTGGEFTLTVIGLMVGFAVLGYLLLAWDKRGLNIPKRLTARERSG